MGSKGRPLFDLNQPPTEDEEDRDEVFSFQPERAVPSSSTQTSDLFAASAGPQGIVNKFSFSHAPFISGFQPFVRQNTAKVTEVPGGGKSAEAMIGEALSSKLSEVERQPDFSSSNPHAVEKEEGEWSDAEGSTDANRNSNMHEDLASGNVVLQENHVGTGDTVVAGDDVSQFSEDVKGENNDIASLELDPDINDRKSNSSRNSESNSTNGLEDSALALKQKETKGVEASYALKLANNPAKRPRVDQYKEVQLGKRRSRQTMFLNLEDVKQAGTLKSSAPRRQNFPAPVTTRTVKEGRLSHPLAERPGEKQIQATSREAAQVELSHNEENGFLEPNMSKPENNGDINAGILPRPRRLNSSTDLATDTQSPTISRQSSWKQPVDLRSAKNSQIPSRKPSFSCTNSMDLKLGTKKIPTKKQPAINTQNQDTSVERLLREVTNEKFWHHPGIVFSSLV